ncbi:PIN domain-like protein [Gymnopilus junonius]|uniref:PIN domain-like protein n=1 Tax=Gymnopilus junonius TaxID=109634 RepID=A0A9P5TRP8_GYMJU|nr:PIN domain-like protein [Gymnopilus junonius]
MGIPGLWKLLEPIARKQSFHRFCVEEGFIRNEATDGRGLRVGVDALGWVYRACYRHSCTKNPELATLYTRCNRLLQLPIHPLFVFDGPDRPRRKRGKHVRGNPHWIEQDFKLMLDTFGFAWINAAGEAESELASLSKQGLLDAVLTEDSDTVVFGARTIIRFDSDVADDEQIILYKAEDIERHPRLSLGTADLMLIALLVGGDYDVRSLIFYISYTT